MIRCRLEIIEGDAVYARWNVVYTPAQSKAWERYATPGLRKAVADTERKYGHVIVVHMPKGIRRSE